VLAQTVREGDVVQDGWHAKGTRETVAESDASARALARSVSAPPRAAADARQAGPPSVPDLEDAGLVLDRASLFRPRGLAVRRRSEYCSCKPTWFYACGNLKFGDTKT